MQTELEEVRDGINRKAKWNDLLEKGLGYACIVASITMLLIMFWPW